MASSSRLDRLRQLVQSDLGALPDRSPSPAEAFSDDDAPGGVLLEPQLADMTSKQTALPSAAKATNQTTAPDANVDRRFVWVQGAESSYNPSLMSHSSPPAKPAISKLPVTTLVRGHLASARHHFTPIQALAKYPYKFCNKSHMQPISSAFFDQGKFWEREWDLYYIWDIENDSKPIILVLESQFQDLLVEINQQLKLGLAITDEQREESLVTQFPDHPRYLPRYLGRSHSREQYDNMVDNAPSKDFRAPNEPVHPPLEDRSLERFKQLMEELWDVQKAKSKAVKAKRQQDRLLKQKSAADQFKRAQRYLGLRPGVAAGVVQSGPPEAIDYSKPVTSPFEKWVVFVCVDVESYERAHDKITEVGIATLDTRDLVGVPPGEDGAAWRKLIRARHFRIKEHAHLVNYQYVAGHPESFDFGQSTFVPLNDAAGAVAACFRPPFGASSTGNDDMVDLMSGINLDENRNIIFLGHDTTADVRYLQQLGFDAMGLKNMVEPLDTATMYRVWKRDQQPTSLGRILHDFDIAGFNLHNAGNDAVFTVQAMLGVCVREATLRGPELEKLRNEEAALKVAAALEDAQQRLRDEAEGWSDYEADGDGGPPVPMQSAPKDTKSHNDTTNSGHSHYTEGSRGGGRGGNRGGGRGRGGLAEAFRGSDYRLRGGRDYHSDNYNGGLDRGGYRGRGPSHGDYQHGGGYGTGRGRGRGRGNFDPNYSSDYNTGTSAPQVRLYDLY
ncbi:hypothetical protein P153DRAFT_403603 [Dothidotthia symphoricarpi CBS 119687]|uniref:Gfd2/YDR514C-like C-terminal domain-containing protein n=1 Tax=Dothidotthia symphoricarpi CBS 119687 TaxID=1392245 RepID=A0A6A6ACM1_9PLEO|nr:uncharacterized protein P153DRAFT_403603 [Dothidotthia symphoricarpi CBS 119687]KAF2128734.1 hypothetical protein P153DRAFT_403603 [Dothidotthia symphoricarpi CBS 119687]